MKMIITIFAAMLLPTFKWSSSDSCQNIAVLMNMFCISQKQNFIEKILYFKALVS